MGKRLIHLPGTTTSGPCMTDLLSLKALVKDQNAAQSDVESFLLNYLTTDLVAGQNDTLTLGFRSSDYNDINLTPVASPLFTLVVWHSGSGGTGVANPANANGPNNGTLATVSTGVGGSATEQMTCEIGANIPSGVVINSAIYRGWFQSDNVLVTSRGDVIARSSTGLFLDKLLYRNEALNNSDSFLGGSFYRDLFTYGLSTEADFRSLRIVYRTTDAVAGVTPHGFSVDAGCLIVSGAFT